MRAPNHPSKQRVVTITPAISTPAATEMAAHFRSIESSTAAREPVHAPVTGRGTATNNANPIYLYFLIMPLFWRVIVNSLSKNLLKNGKRLSSRDANSTNKRITGTGRRFPITARGNTVYHGISRRFTPKGIAPRSSINGNAAIIIITSSGGIPAEINAWLIFSANNKASFLLTFEV